VEGGAAAAELAERIGYASDSKQTKYRHGEVTWNFSPSPAHPITRNFAQVTLTDETYWQLLPGATSQPNILAKSTEDGTDYPQCWIHEPKSGGRVFVTLGGHYSTSFDTPTFRLLVLRGIAWAAGAPVDRFNTLLKAGLE
jgi:type 1 glutamine amidotransferase